MAKPITKKAKEKRPVGRPRKFQSLPELQKLIDNYFKSCLVDKIPLTITGLALALDSSRKALMEIEKNYPPEFCNTIKKAKLKVENDYEIALREHGRAGEIFGLKNFGWRDKSEVGLDLLGGSALVQILAILPPDYAEIVKKTLERHNADSPKLT
jgi:hypothetical protein